MEIVKITLCENFIFGKNGCDVRKIQYVMKVANGTNYEKYVRKFGAS